jgi:hypothetical protein
VVRFITCCSTSVYVRFIFTLNEICKGVKFICRNSCNNPTEEKIAILLSWRCFIFKKTVLWSMTPHTVCELIHGNRTARLAADNNGFMSPYLCVEYIHTSCPLLLVTLTTHQWRNVMCAMCRACCIIWVVPMTEKRGEDPAVLNLDTEWWQVVSF